MGDAEFEHWWVRLRAEAARREASWLIGGERDFYRPSFEAGRSPEEEVEALQQVAEWRGCGCSGG